MKRGPRIVISKLLINKAAEREDGGKYRFWSSQRNELLQGCRRAKGPNNAWQHSSPLSPTHPAGFFTAPSCFSQLTPNPEDPTVTRGAWKRWWGGHLLLVICSRRAL